MIVEVGEKLHITYRRMFPEDVVRHFVGIVVRVTDLAIRLKGFVWVFNSGKGTFIRKPDMVERIFFPDDAQIINVLPQNAEIEQITYMNDPTKGMGITDGRTFFLEITEFSAMR